MKTDNILRLHGVGRNVLLIACKCVCVGHYFGKIEIHDQNDNDSD